jgi:hypothetical protein
MLEKKDDADCEPEREMSLKLENISEFKVYFKTALVMNQVSSKGCWRKKPEVKNLAL